MALSVLSLGLTTGPATHMIWDSNTQSCCLTGTQEELFGIKHKMETAEQQAANREWAKQFREEMRNYLIAAGNSPEDTDTFLKSKMPYLYDNY